MIIGTESKVVLLVHHLYKDSFLTLNKAKIPKHSPFKLTQLEISNQLSKSLSCNVVGIETESLHHTFSKNSLSCSFMRRRLSFNEFL